MKYGIGVGMLYSGGANIDRFGFFFSLLKYTNIWCFRLSLDVLQWFLVIENFLPLHQ